MKLKVTHKNQTTRNSKKVSTSFSNLEIVTVAVYLLGGDSRYTDTEDIAVKVNELAPGRFTWRKYPDQINIESVRRHLSFAKNSKIGGYIIGSHSDGWILTEKGLKFCRKNINKLNGVDLSRPPIDQKQLKWIQREKTRMIVTSAFEKVLLKNEDKITLQEAETFFRLDEYVKGNAREKKLNKYINTFSDDPEIGKTVKKLANKVEKNERNSR